MAKTLDLLKAVLQPSFNMEVKRSVSLPSSCFSSLSPSSPLSPSLPPSLSRLCEDYHSIYRQAADNIRENTGDMVPEATLRLLVSKMLEEVYMYMCIVSMSQKNTLPSTLHIHYM